MSIDFPWYPGKSNYTNFNCYLYSSLHDIYLKKKDETFFTYYFIIVNTFASIKYSATTINKIFSNANYIHVKRIAYGHISYLLSLKTFSRCNYIRTTQYSSPHSNDSLSRLSLSYLPFLFLPSSSLSPRFAMSFPINIYTGYLLFRSSNPATKRSVESLLDLRIIWIDIWSRSFDKRKSTLYNWIRCGVTQFHEQWSGIMLRIKDWVCVVNRGSLTMNIT